MMALYNFISSLIGKKKSLINSFIKAEIKAGRLLSAFNYIFKKTENKR